MAALPNVLFILSDQHNAKVLKDISEDEDCSFAVDTEGVDAPFQVRISEDELPHLGREGEDVARVLMALKLRLRLTTTLEIVPEGHWRRIILNGLHTFVPKGLLSYMQIVAMAHPLRQEMLYTVTVRNRKGGCTLRPGENIQAEEGMIVDVMDTSCA